MIRNDDSHRPRPQARMVPLKIKGGQGGRKTSENYEKAKEEVAKLKEKGK